MKLLIKKKLNLDRVKNNKKPELLSSKILDFNTYPVVTVELNFNPRISVSSLTPPHSTAR
jgi:hypothetical protein